MTRILYSSLQILLCFFVASQGYAKSDPEDYIWKGNSSDQWELGSNWNQSPGASSSGAQLYKISRAGSHDAVISSSTTINYNIDYVDLYNYGSLTIQDKIVSVVSGVQVRGGSELVLDNGAVLNTPELRILDKYSTVVVNQGAMLNVNGTVYMGAKGMDEKSRYNLDGTDGAPALLLKGGAITCSDLYFYNNTNDEPIVECNDGNFQINGNAIDYGVSAGFSVSGSATLIVSGNASFGAGKDNIAINGNAAVTVGGNFVMSNANDNFVMSGGNLSVGGDWKTTSSVAMTGGSVIFDGTLEQTLQSNGTITFNDLIVDNSALGITLGKSIAVAHSLKFVRGIISGSAINTVTFTDDATVTGFDATKYISGKVVKIGDDAFTFPLYPAIGISAPGATTDVFAAQYYGMSPAGTYSVSSKESPLYKVSDVEYWILNHSVASSSTPVSVTLYWNSSSLVNDLADLRVAKWDNVTSKWLNLGNTTVTGNGSEGAITSASITAFSPFTLATVSSDNPLPIELSDFYVEAIGNECVALQWVTQSETNNDFFEVQRSQDLKEWNTVGKINGAGRSTTSISYQLADCNFFPGVYYYRLRQVDFDGASTYSWTIKYAVADGLACFGDIIVYPTSIEDHFDVAVTSEMKRVVHIALYSLQGEVLLEQDGVSNEVCTVYVADIPSGMYVVDVVCGDSRIQTTVLKR